MSADKVKRVIDEMLTDQRGANLMLLADIVGGMDAEELQALRTLVSQDPERKAMRSFLFGAKSETLQFFAEARPEEMVNLKDALRFWVALTLIGKVGRWFVMVFLGTAISAAAAWNTIAPWFKGAKP